jgi:hypothetical protein
MCAVQQALDDAYLSIYLVWISRLVCAALLVVSRWRGLLDQVIRLLQRLMGDGGCCRVIIRFRSRV